MSRGCLRLFVSLILAGCARPLDSARLVEQLDDRQRGRVAADQLREREDTNTEDALLAGLRSSSPGIRSHCIRLLLEKNPPQFNAEVERLVGDENGAVGREAARALVQLNEDERLVSFVEDSSRPILARQRVAHQMFAAKLEMVGLQERWLADQAVPGPLKVEAASWLAASEAGRNRLRAILREKNQPAELRTAARAGLGLPRSAQMLDNRVPAQPVDRYKRSENFKVECLAFCRKGDTIHARWKGPGMVRDDQFVAKENYSSFWFSQESDASGWPVGAYSVELWLNDAREGRCGVSFQVVP